MRKFGVLGTVALMTLALSTNGCNWDRTSVSEDPGATQGYEPEDGPLADDLTETNIGRAKKTEDVAPLSDEVDAETAQGTNAPEIEIIDNDQPQEDPQATPGR